MKRFNNLMAAMDVKEESRKRALLFLKQESHETVDEFHTRLQIASKYCEFGDNKENLKRLTHKLNWGHRIKSYDELIPYACSHIDTITGLCENAL